MAAAYGGYLELVKFLVSKGVDVNEESVGGTPLNWAIRGGKLEVAEFLISKGVNVNADGAIGTPLHVATDVGNVEFVKFLISKGADVNAGSEIAGNLLYFASQRDNDEVIETLISAGAQ